MRTGPGVTERLARACAAHPGRRSPPGASCSSSPSCWSRPRCTASPRPAPSRAIRSHTSLRLHRPGVPAEPGRLKRGRATSSSSAPAATDRGAAVRAFVARLVAKGARDQEGDQPARLPERARRLVSRDGHATAGPASRRLATRTSSRSSRRDSGERAPGLQRRDHRRAHARPRLQQALAARPRARRARSSACRRR